MRKSITDSFQRLPVPEPTNQQLALYHGNSFIDDDEDVLDLREYWEIIWKHKLTVIVFLLISLIATAVSTSLQPLIYRSTLTLQIERSSNRAFNNSNMMMYEDFYSTDFYQTQYELLKSLSLAERVARDLELTSYDRFKGKGNTSFIEDSVISGKAAGIDGEDDSVGKDEPLYEPEQFAGILRAGLTISPIKNSRLSHISFDSESPQLAADVVNSYARNFMDMNIERRVADASYAQKFLTEQIKQVRANLEDSELRLVEYAGDKKIANLDDKLSGYLQKLKILNERLITVEATRISAQAYYDEMKAIGTGSIPQVTDSLLIHSLKRSLASLTSEYNEDLSIYKPAYPGMVQKRGKITALQNKLREEVDNIERTLETKYKASFREESMLKSRIRQINQEVLDMRKRTTDYQAIKRDVDTNLVLYDSLLQQVKEIGVTAGVTSNNISIVDTGRVPLSSYKPDLRKNLMMALVVGLLGGIGLAFLFDKLDDTIKTSQQLEKLTGLAVLGIVPEVDKKSIGITSVGLLAKDDPKSPVAEAYRSFRTALSLSTVDGHPSVLHISSSGIGEGKTTTALGASMTFIQAGARVLLVDADLRSPSIHRELSLPNELGLTSYLAGDYRLDKVLHDLTNIDGLWVLPAGPIPPNPAELLASSKMQKFLSTAEEQFDIVIIDGPPVLGLADSLVLSNMASATVLVVDSGTTRKGILSDTMKRLQGVNANVIGTILTKYNQGHSSYHYLYSYYGISKEEKQKKFAS